MPMPGFVDFVIIEGVSVVKVVIEKEKNFLRLWFF